MRSFARTAEASWRPRPSGASERAHQYLGDQDTWDWNPSLDLFRRFAGALEVLEKELIGAPVRG